MQSFVRFALVAVLLSAGAGAQNTPSSYFPEGVISSDPWSDKFIGGWFSHELTALQEPSLWRQSTKSSSESYRFLWLRTFHKPIAIRIDVRSDGTAILTTKVGTGASGFPRTSIGLSENISRPIPAFQTEAVLQRIKRSEFWSLPSNSDTATGTDGAEWIIEGVKDGKYHVVRRWSPETGAVRDIGFSFVFGLAQMGIPKGEVY